MGKAEDLRALREARYNRNQATVAPATKAKVAKKALAAAVAPKVTPDEVCGHRAISGKTCTRPKDHSEKNHRYVK